MLKKQKTHECGGVENLKNIEVPQIKMKKTDYGDAVDLYKLSQDVSDFLMKLKITKNIKLTKKNYDVFLRNVDDLCKKHRANSSDFLAQGNSLSEMLELCDDYIKKGKDVDRVGKIRELKKIIKQANKERTRAVLGSETGTGRGRTIRGLNKGSYKEVVITGGIAKEFERGKDIDRFVNNEILQRVIIASDVTKIPSEAFIKCTNLETIVIEPRSNKELVFKTHCISTCSKLKRIKIQGGLDDCANIKFEPGAIGNKRYKSVVIPLK